MFTSPTSKLSGYTSAKKTQIVQRFKPDYRVKLAGDKAQEKLAREQEAYRVNNIAKNPKTQEPLLTQDIPGNAIRSRQGSDVFGDVAVFLPTDLTLQEKLGAYLQEIKAICEEHLMPQDFIIQLKEALHFAFYYVIPPSIKEDFLCKKSDQKENSWEASATIVQEFLDGEQPSMRFKEITFNNDGHLVFRATIQQSASFMELRNRLNEIFPEKHERYTDPEKITTLASVLAVINLKSVTKEAEASLGKKDKINRVDRSAEFRNALNVFLEKVTREMSGKSFTFNRIDWLEWSNRMLQEEGILGRLSMFRSSSAELHVFTESCSLKHSDLSLTS